MACSMCDAGVAVTWWRCGSDVMESMAGREGEHGGNDTVVVDCNDGEGAEWDCSHYFTLS